MPVETSTTTLLLLTQREMARALSLSERSLYSLRQRGLPALLIGSTVRYSPAAVMAWLQEHHAASVPADAK
jgi:predicted DNA-binding transcriptional regulator AlpA